ncbi:MAG: HAMP domain-containing protein [Akkermansiaceae bacterium]|nr:HAMP domain-containing protein [Akkermansiaceae bacterium]
MKITSSIRMRLAAWLAVFLAVILAGFGITAYQLQRKQVMSRVDESLAKRVAEISRDARGGPPGPRTGPPDFGRQEFDGPPPTPGDGGPPPLRLTESTLRQLDEESGIYHVVWGFTGALRGAGGGEVPERPEGSREDTRTKFRTRGDRREAYHFTELGECVLAGRSIAPELTALRRFGARLGFAGLGVLALGLGGLWWLISRALRPVKQMSGTAERIAAGNLSERIDGFDPDSELGRLAAVLNSTFDRLEASFDRQRQFTSDASHELRTPLSVMISEAQTALARERSGAEYREALEECLDAGRRMSGLTSSLLELARIDGTKEETCGFDLGELVEEKIEEHGNVAAAKGLRLETDLKSAAISAGPTGTGIVISNLLMNAIHYTPSGGTIHISTGTDGDGIFLRVEDTGIGITEEDLPHVFDRFYRADKSRSRAEGRHGLGLAICKGIVESQGATIGVTSEPGAGSVFTVRWPAE